MANGQWPAANGSRREQFSITPHAMWGDGVRGTIAARENIETKVCSARRETGVKSDEYA